MGKILIVDGNALIHRAYHAIPQTFRTAEGELVNAVYGFTSMLLNALREEKPQYCALTFDLKGPTFRSVEFADYKATRQRAPDDLYGQIPRIRSLVDTFNVPIFEKEGFEADDMIGTLSLLAKNQSIESTVLTGDMDSFQLIDELVSVLTPQGGFQKAKKYDPEEVFKRLGVWPRQVIDFKALKGDVSDNIPGIPGIGEKTAVDLLGKYHTLDGIYENIEQITGAVKAKLLTGKESGYLSQRIATIVRDIPVEVDFEKCDLKNMNFEKTLELFQELQFKSLIGKLYEVRRFSGVKDVYSKPNYNAIAGQMKNEVEKSLTQQSLF